MSTDVLRTLFHPFEAEALSWPLKGGRVLFPGAEAGLRPPSGFDATLHLVQGFRPHFRSLQAAGFNVSPQAQGDGFNAAFVLAGRHRGQNELRIAEALERVAPGGLIVVAGAKDDGIASLRKRIDDLVPLDGHMPKYHGIAFWFRRPADLAAAQGLRAANPALLVDGRFRTAPGMFSFDKVDAGSKLLAENLPGDLRGAVADFCAGWGYVAAQVAALSPGLTALDLYEAEFDALEAAKGNVGSVVVEPGFFWTDLLTETVERRYDAIVMNPPFHRSRAAEPEIGAGMIRAVAKALKPGGRLFMVANRQLPYEPVLSAAFSSHSELARDGMFKVLAARR